MIRIINYQQKVQIEMSVCECGIKPSTLVNEGGKGLSGKKTRKKKSIYALIYIYRYIYIYIYRYISRRVLSVSLHRR
jgi:hypothetical protein